jgi:hypothetical protein
MTRSASRWKGAGASAVLAVALVALAYSLPASVGIDFGRRIEGALGSSGFYDLEGSYRWSRARSEIVFPDPGARAPVRLELVLSGFRPPGSEPPRVVIVANGRTSTITPSRRIETYALEGSTSGLWSSTSRVQIRSDTFVPGAGDERALGVRVHGARLVLEGPAVPSLRQLVAAALVAALLALRAGAPAGVALAFVFGAGYHFFRFQTALLVPSLALACLLLALAARIAPTSVERAILVPRRFARLVLEGARPLRQTAALVAAAMLVLGTVAAYALHPRVDVPLGTGLAEPLLHRFGGYDRDSGGVLFRRPFPGAFIDLTDFGTSSPWVVSIEAFDRSRKVELPAPPWGYSPGHVLRFSESDGRVASVSIDRGRSLPPLRVLLLLLSSWMLFTAAFGACGLSFRAALACGSVSGVLILAGIGAAPVFFIPLLDRIALAAGTALAAAALARSVLRSVSSIALSIAAAAMALWFLASASPLYSGGHFAYHTSVAEEIWGGKFFLYYFPGPENMLSHQPQWGNMTVPHPSLYHTVTAPLAFLPREGFHLATKMFLALLLSGVTLVASSVARAAASARDAGSDGEKAGIYAAFVAVALPTSWQLLGLGHLMTIFGSFAAAAALGYIALVTTRLTERRTWLLALALTTFAFLSYTGSLLFGSIALMFASGALLLSEPALGRRLGWLLLLAWGLALLLYYIHWVAPFVGETLPRMLSGAGSDPGIDWTARLGLLPQKLDYTFGSFWVALAGLLGLVLAEARPRRLVLYGWGLVLPLFCVFDLAFNFLLKHHYFSFPAVAIGGGLALFRLEQKGRFGMAVFLAVVVYLCVSGAASVYRLATGAP